MCSACCFLPEILSQQLKPRLSLGAVNRHLPISKDDVALAYHAQ